MTTPVIDAYGHVGRPRFGRAADLRAVLSTLGIEKTVLSMGPLVPDYAELFGALEMFGDQVRGVGIPFGRTLAQMEETVALQLRAGVMAVRIEEPELMQSPAVLDAIGAAGRWIYGISLIGKPAVVRSLLDWLERYPAVHLAMPHFVDIDLGKMDDTLTTLLGHPRVYPIFSRQGNMGSRESYPHGDFRPWVEQVIERAGWDRIMWGSEYPVLYWRNETPAQCRDWLGALLPDATAEQLAGYLGGNAQRAIFDAPPPPRESVTIPAWVDEQFNRDRTIPLFVPQGIQMPMAQWATLQEAFVQAQQGEPDLTYEAFILARLGR